MKNRFTYLLMILFSVCVQSQDYPAPTNLVTIPTAGVLVRGSYTADARIQNGGGLIFGLSVGITDRFMFGLSYGAGNLIGDDSLKWYLRPEVNLKYRLIDEDLSRPGIAIGLETQGLGEFDADSLKRYSTKALGAYLTMSKNWKSPLGNAGLHAGINYNFTEQLDGDDDVSAFAGFDVEINPELSFIMEYNAALNENDIEIQNIALSRGGYLNTAIRWTFVDHLHIELEFNNLLFNEKNESLETFTRELKITYIEYF